MLKATILIAVSAFAFALASDAPSRAQNSSGFEKRNFSYNEWTKGKFSEVVTVTNPGKFIFLAGIGPEREGDGKIVHEGNFMEQCRYAYMKIKKLLKSPVIFDGRNIYNQAEVMKMGFTYYGIGRK